MNVNLCCSRRTIVKSGSADVATELGLWLGIGLRLGLGIRLELGLGKGLDV